MNQLLPLTESEALFAPFQDPWLSRQMDFALVPAGGVGFRNEINWDSVYVKWDACPLGEVAGGLEIPIIAANLQRLICRELAGKLRKPGRQRPDSKAV